MNERKKLEKENNEIISRFDKEREDFHRIFQQNLEEIKKLKDLLVKNEILLRAAVEREKAVKQSRVVEQERSTETSRMLSKLIKNKNLMVKI